jgi:hypothetical protein
LRSRVANRKISDLADGGALQATDEVEVARGSLNLKVAGSKFGGSLPSPLALPTAEPTGVTIDTTTYDNPITGVGKLTTLVFPAAGGGDHAVLAIAVAGDAFPRYLIASDSGDGIHLGTGAEDAYGTNKSIAASDTALVLEGPNGNIWVGDTTVARGPTTRFQTAIAIGGSGGDRSAISSAGGVPDALPGQENDLYIRGDAPDVNHYLYRCTVTGTAGNATWVPIGGLT